MDDSRTFMQMQQDFLAELQEFDPTFRAEAKAEAGEVEEKQALTVEELEF
jgi:hypothetical protein